MSNSLRNFNTGQYSKSITITIGMKFGMLTVIAFSDYRNKSRSKHYFCKCDCGTEKIVGRPSLISKGTKSCGCYNSISKLIYPGEASWNLLFYSCKRSAKIRNLDFSITKEEFKEICLKNCFYCNEKPRFFNRYLDFNGKNIRNIKNETLERSNIFANGIDRKNNLLGYILNNCVSCCKICNEMKMDRTSEEFFNHINKIINFKNAKS